MKLNTLKENLANYFRENAAILICGLAMLNGDANVNKIYYLLDKQS